QLTAVAVAAFAFAAWAPRAGAVAVSGTVLDPAGKPVEYATVSIAALKKGAATDDQGRFTFDLPAGRWILEVAQLGYEKAHVILDVADQPVAAHVRLREEPIPLAEV